MSRTFVLKSEVSPSEFFVALEQKLIYTFYDNLLPKGEA